MEARQGTTHPGTGHQARDARNNAEGWDPKSDQEGRQERGSPTKGAVRTPDNDFTRGNRQRGPSHNLREHTKGAREDPIRKGTPRCRGPRRSAKRRRSLR